jgi:adenine-specific DNA-methyltransferase
MEEDYYTKHIITYMGNKRKFVGKIKEIIELVKNEIGEKNINIAEGFSGSGVLSRVFKDSVMGDYSQPLKNFYVNDLAGYSNTLNQCYLTSSEDFTPDILEELCYHLKRINYFLSIAENKEPFISKYWAPKDDNNIQEGERAYFTQKNAEIIDKSMYYIHNYVEERLKPYLLAPLLVECSIHNNTNGQFSAYYKNAEKTKGMYGGKNKIDVKRICGEITPKLPILSNKKANVIISQEDANIWVKNIPDVDLVYYDPPYNKHPYNIYYFLLDIINNWDIEQEIPDTYRGQPKNWTKSSFCSYTKAIKVFEKLIMDTKSKFILISYNSKGIISIEEMDTILSRKGKVYKIPVDHNVYNKLIGIAAKKRQKKNEKINEFLWLVDTRTNNSY